MNVFNFEKGLAIIEKQTNEIRFLKSLSIVYKGSEISSIAEIFLNDEEGSYNNCVHLDRLKQDYTISNHVFFEILKAYDNLLENNR